MSTRVKPGSPLERDMRHLARLLGWLHLDRGSRQPLHRTADLWRVLASPPWRAQSVQARIRLTATAYSGRLTKDPAQQLGELAEVVIVKFSDLTDTQLTALSHQLATSPTLAARWASDVTDTAWRIWVATQSRAPRRVWPY